MVTVRDCSVSTMSSVWRRLTAWLKTRRVLGHGGASDQCSTPSVMSRADCSTCADDRRLGRCYCITGQLSDVFPAQELSTLNPARTVPTCSNFRRSASCRMAAREGLRPVLNPEIDSRPRPRPRPRPRRAAIRCQIGYNTASWPADRLLGIGRRHPKLVVPRDSTRPGRQGCHDQQAGLCRELNSRAPSSSRTCTSRYYSKALLRSIPVPSLLSPILPGSSPAVLIDDGTRQARRSTAAGL